MSDNLPMDRWWTPVEVAIYMRLAEKTIRNWASAKPERLPPRIKALSDLRWEPSVCVEWSRQQSGTGVGRKRLR